MRDAIFAVLWILTLGLLLRTKVQTICGPPPPGQCNQPVAHCHQSDEVSDWILRYVRLTQKLLDRAKKKANWSLHGQALKMNKRRERMRAAKALREHPVGRVAKALVRAQVVERTPEPPDTSSDDLALFE